MRTGFEGQPTPVIRARRDMLVERIWEAGVAIAKGEKEPYKLARAVVPMQVMFVEQMDAELLRRGEAVPAPPWEE